jgi:hypothetical protein
MKKVAMERVWNACSDRVYTAAEWNPHFCLIGFWEGISALAAKNLVYIPISIAHSTSSLLVTSQQLERLTTWSIFQPSFSSAPIGSVETSNMWLGS